MGAKPVGAKEKYRNLDEQTKVGKATAKRFKREKDLVDWSAND